MRIIVDAMSGDFAPLETIKGASLAAKEYSDHKIVLVGDENVISDVAIKNEIDCRLYLAIVYLCLQVMLQIIKDWIVDLG